jgi:NTE family protein
LAHVGVLQALERAQIPIDCLAGTSAGAIIGAMYCAGMPAKTLFEVAMRLKWWNIARPSMSPRGLVTFAPMERWLIRLLGDLRFTDLPTPFVAVATDLEHGKPVILREGRIAPAVRASSSVPGVVTPVVLGGYTLCDGGVSDNLPVDAVRSLGADFVIGVNLFDPYFPRPRNMFSAGFAAVETMVRRAGGGIEQADCLINPDLVRQSYLRFSNKLDLITRGETAAEAKIENIKAALGSGQRDGVAVNGHMLVGEPGERIGELRA